MSAINRSTYQKKCEENKRLLTDIKILAGPINAERARCAKKWRDKFRKEDEFRRLLKIAAAEYMKDHPEYNIIKKTDNDR